MGKMNKKQLDTIESFIGQESCFKGDISTDKTVRIDGVFTGNVVKALGVIVGEKATITGNITAEYVIVNGSVEGNIISSQAVELLNKSKVIGNIQTKILSVAEGAVFEGKSAMLNLEEPDNIDSQDTTEEEII